MINFRKILYTLRTKGPSGVMNYINLYNFEKNILGNKTVEWCEDGFWKMHPMPSQKDLDRYYQEVYWLSNSDYKSNMVVARDLKHAAFIKEHFPESFAGIKNFLNYGAGHGGVSYLLHPLGCNIYNVEPGGLFEFNLDNFYTYSSIDELNEANINITFDIIYASHVIEHLRDPLEFFSEAINLLHEDGKIILEVPNTRVKNPSKNYDEGGCDGKTSGSHTLYYTKDFFENLGAQIFFYGGDYNEANYPQMPLEDEANFIRAVISYQGLKKYLDSK